MSSDSIKYLLNEDRIPRDWYNLIADLPAPPPPVLHPGTHQPVGPDDLAPLFPMSLILQEVASERTIEIPNPVRESIGNGDQPHSTAHGVWSRHSIHQHGFTTSMRGLVQLEVISQTLQWPRHFITKKRE